MTISTPTLLQPINNYSTRGRNSILLQSSDYYNNSPEVHLSSDWQVSSSSNFSSFIDNIQDDENNLTSYSLDVSTFTNQKLYWRVRYKDSSNSYSSWSKVFSINLLEQEEFYKADIERPSLFSPFNGFSSDVNIGIILLVASKFTSKDYTHEWSQWRIHKNDELLIDTGGVDNLTSYSLNLISNFIENGDKLEWQVQYSNTTNKIKSEWSEKYTIELASENIESNSELISRPQLLLPVENGTQDNDDGYTILSSSPFNSSNLESIHKGTNWIIARDRFFTQPILDTGIDSINLTNLSFDQLSYDVFNGDSIYWRNKYVSNLNKESLWSETRKYNYVDVVLIIEKPYLSSPQDQYTPDVINGAFNLVSSPYSSIPSSVHEYSKWQVSRNPGFTDLILDDNSYTNLTSLNFNPNTYELQNGYSIFWRIKYIGRLESSIVEGPWSDYREIIFTLTPTIIYSPINLYPSNGTSRRVGEGTFTMTWNYSGSEFPSGISQTGSHIQISKNGFASNFIDQLISGATNSFNFDPNIYNIVNGEDIQWRVKTFGGGLESNWTSYSISFDAVWIPGTPETPGYFTEELVTQPRWSMHLTAPETWQGGNVGVGLVTGDMYYNGNLTLQISYQKIVQGYVIAQVINDGIHGRIALTDLETSGLGAQGTTPGILATDAWFSYPGTSSYQQVWHPPVPATPGYWLQ